MASFTIIYGETGRRPGQKGHAYWPISREHGDVMLSICLVNLKDVMEPSIL